MAPSRVLVAGGGIIGLRTALELCRKQVQVVLRAPHNPVKESCSMGAGGYWMPFHCDDARCDRWSMETYDEYYQYFVNNNNNNQNNNNNNNNQNNNKDLVERMYAVIPRRTKAMQQLPGWTQQDPRLEFQELSTEMLAWQNSVLQLKIPPLQELKNAGYEHAWLFRTIVVNPPNMMQHYLNELITVHGANVDVDIDSGIFYESLSHVQESARELDCDLVINCTGMGSRSLVPDPTLIPVRGALLVFERESAIRRPPILQSSSSYEESRENIIRKDNNEERQQQQKQQQKQQQQPPRENNNTNIHDAVITIQEEPWGNETYPVYMRPRGSDLVVGGTYLEGDEEPLIRPKERQRLLINAQHLGLDVSSCTIKREWVGFRPFRSTIRCEFDNNNGLETMTSSRDQPTIPIFHNYGYGGSGWTIGIGGAKECANQVLTWIKNNRTNGSS